MNKFTRWISEPKGVDLSYNAKSWLLILGFVVASAIIALIGGAILSDLIDHERQENKKAPASQELLLG